jgi:hypothetical protein
MSDHETSISRQPRGPFTKVAERQAIRYVAEQSLESWRYRSEQAKRFALYAKWVGIGCPAALAVYKFVEGILAKGH